MSQPSTVESAITAPLGGLSASTLYLMAMQTNGTTRKVVCVQWPAGSILQLDNAGLLQIVPTGTNSGSLPMSCVPTAQTVINKITANTNPAAYMDASAFDAAGAASAAQSAAQSFATSQIAVLTAGSPDALNTFLEAYNRFLTDESAASALNTALATETTNRTTADATNAAAITSEATARASADTSEATTRAEAVTTLTAAIAAKATANGTTATLDFGFSTGNEGDVATATVSASWVTATSRIVCLPSPSDSPDHSTEETLVEDIRFSAKNIIVGVSFDVEACAPNGTWGRHNCSILAI